MKRAERTWNHTPTLFWHLFSLTQMYIASVLKQLFPSLPPEANENIARHSTKCLLRWQNTKSQHRLCSPPISSSQAAGTEQCPSPAQPRVPHGAHQPCQQSPLIIVAELHNSRRLKLLTDPLALLHIVDEHKLQANVLAVGMLARENTNREALGASGSQRN